MFRKKYIVKKINLHLLQAIGSNLYEITSSGLTNSMADDIPFGPYFQTFLFPETYNV